MNTNTNVAAWSQMLSVLVTKNIYFLYLLLLLLIQKAQRKNISCGFKYFLYFEMISAVLLPAGGTLTFLTFIFIYVEFLHLYTYNI